MPDTDFIIWTGLSSLIVIMLGIIGYLVKTGFESLREELKKMWEKLDDSAKDRAELRAEIAEIRARCEERGNNCPGGHHHNRVTDLRA